MTVTLTPKSGTASRRPRDIVELMGAWDLAHAPRLVEARLFWYTQGKGTEDVGIVEKQSVDLPGVRGERSFKFPLPSAPYSFSGRLISLRWAFELVAGDEAARWEFTMSPSGSEISTAVEPVGASR